MSNAPATEPQINFIKSLRDSRGLAPLSDEVYAQVTKADASEAITKLKEMPKAAKPAIETPNQDEVPAGRYALKADDGQVYFFKVEHGKDRWAGYTFVKRQSSDDLYPVKDPAKRANILKRIAADMYGAMALYGKEIGRCGHCHKTLTSDWREKGIGPICAKNMGWEG